MKSSLRDEDIPETLPAPPPPSAPGPGDGAAREALLRPSRSGWITARDGGLRFEPGDRRPGGIPAAYLPAYRLEHLGDPSFCREHGLRYPCVSGAMANGIGSVEVVEAMGRAGMLGFFGSAGLDPAAVAAAVDRLRADLGDRVPFGVNFIHSPQEPELEEALVDLFLDRGVRLVEASAFMAMTPALVRYRARGLRRGPDGRIRAPNRVVAKASRVEVAARFFSPPPEGILRELAASGRITAEEARLAASLPVARDLTAEADSGGHTDNRPAVALLPTMIALRDRLQREHGYADPLRVGAAGGIATPASAAAAFSMGAAWILTGSINQACVESGSSDAVRAMLAEAEQADVAMAPAADMFEMGVKVQVLKRGTMFPMRARKLHDLYRAHGSLEEIPAAEREALEKQVFRAPLEAIWRETREWFLQRDPAEVDRAASDPRHRMALVFRWYLGMSSRWANAGEPTRRLDYQVWCGPAMGAFNEWARGSFLQEPANRRVAVLGMNLLYGAAVLLRAGAVRAQGIPIPPDAAVPPPLPLEAIEERLR